MTAPVDVVTPVEVQEAYDYVIFDRSAESADLVIGTAPGDILQRVTVTVSPAVSALNIYDGTVAAGTLVLSIPAGTAVGTSYELGVKASTNWTGDDDANAGTVICVGSFT